MDPLTFLFDRLDRLKWWWDARHERREHKQMVKRLNYHRKRVRCSLEILENCDLPGWLKKPK